ncbi:MAG: SDR family NAD(P)-dependent oxidoreductase [Treponema sp.]|nr:SDR family NAD(P)-dependent oxidoreductase [Treponema sp.]
MKRIMIVTGASSGMGVCFARQLAEESAGGKVVPSDEIWIIARREDRLLETKRLIEEDSRGRGNYPSVKTVPLDISGKNGARQFREVLQNAAEKEEIEVSVLVNNAGFGTYGEFAQTDTEREMDMVDLDCTSLTGITGFCLPYMKKGGRIINTASLASFMPLGNFAVYGACKAYVLSFSIALAAELKQHGISVTSLCPGPVSTEFANVASKGARKEVRHGLSPEKTVEHCIKCSRKGRHYSMWAFKWKFKAFMSRFIGRYAGAWFTWKYCKRPSN